MSFNGEPSAGRRKSPVPFLLDLLEYLTGYFLQEQR
ncbi:MAG: hypothetical protein AVDCRST_MAG37-1892 [uncultured Rubrobacteraceae bacterium]|uniref:Uncharacterized protein n=1 Tax=uncultured Rubrobacteraceae bacterium TaxID=349277 RepID=A0A6J4QT90_9ACTN|nr:MAG: hypothetical protein AVDCRST_MAG37-1892 [uncultured Rubrobacteraceae bacterium]